MAVNLFIIFAGLAQLKFVALEFFLFILICKHFSTNMFYYSKFTQIARISGLIWEPTKIFVNYYSKPSIVLTKLINKTKTRR